jgi:hypothetical protein
MARIAVVSFLIFLALSGCEERSQPARNGNVDGSAVKDAGQATAQTAIRPSEKQWFVREIQYGEYEARDGSGGLAFYGKPEPVAITNGQLTLTFHWANHQERTIAFDVTPDGSDAVVISCPQTNMAVGAGALPDCDDTALNNAISKQEPVIAAQGQWTTFFNDGLAGAFPSDWQIWWGATEPSKSDFNSSNLDHSNNGANT